MGTTNDSRPLRSWLWAYAAGNLGDDLLISLIAQRFPSVDFDLVTFRWNIPEGFEYDRLLAQHHNLHLCYRDRIVELPAFFKGANKLAHQAFVILGGSMFPENEGWKKVLRGQGQLIRSLAGGSTCRCIIDSNFGPYSSSAFVRRYARFFRRFDDVCFRDDNSSGLFDSPIRVEPDAAFALDPDEFARGDNGTVISVVGDKFGDRQSDYVKLLRDFVVNAPVDARPFTFVSFCSEEGDVHAAHDLIECLPVDVREYCALHSYQGDLRAMLDCIAGARYVLGTRFHSMVLGLVFGKPTITLSYSKKIENQAAWLRRQGFLEGPEGVVSAEDLGDACADQIWDALHDGKTPAITQECRRCAERQFDGLRHFVEKGACDGEL